MRLSLRVLITCFLVSSISQIADAQVLRTVALTGNPAPGTPDGVSFGSFGFYDSPSLNSDGYTAFRASLAGASVDDSNLFGIWSEGSGSLELVAREGDPAPNTPGGVTFSGYTTFIFGIPELPKRHPGLGPPILNSAGTTVFNAALAGTSIDGTNEVGIWAGGTRTLEKVVREGDPAPGLPSGVFFSYPEKGPSLVQTEQVPLLNAASQTAFLSYLTGTGVDATNDSSFWSEGSGTLQLLAREGDQAPGTPSGVVFAEFGLGNFDNNFSLNAAGNSAFRADLAGTGVDFNNRDGIWSNRGGSLSLVVRSGEQIPGMPSGTTLRVFSSPSLNSEDQLAFAAQVVDTSLNSSFRSILSEGSGSLQIVARQGDAAPGLPGVSFGTVSDPFLNSTGQTAFSGSLLGGGLGNPDSLWSEGLGSLHLVARQYDIAPGSLRTFEYLFDVVLNGAGQAAFMGQLSHDYGPVGIWAEDRAGVLKNIAIEGGLLEVAPGDFRTINRLSFYFRSNNGRLSGFNDMGQIAFSAMFTDGTSGVFVSNLVAVPEPSTVWLSFVSIAILLAAQRRLHLSTKRVSS